MCWSCLGDNHWHSHPLYIKTPFLARHDSWHTVCLRSPHTRVCPLCVRTLGSFSITLGIVIRLRRVCLLCAEVPSWLQPSMLSSVACQESSLRPARLSALSYVFIVLKLQSIRCVLGLVFCLGHQIRVCPLHARACPAQPSA